MTQPEFSIPKKLEQLQNKLLNLRKSGKLLLQNGDYGNASAPSNIALIKYWGKSKTVFQHPDNSSISLTLNNFKAETSVTVSGRFFPEGENLTFIPKHSFSLTDSISNKSTTCLSNKLELFLKRILHPFATDIGLVIESKNNFPTACGLASSAAGMAALCFAIDDLLNLKTHFTEQQRQYWISQWARIGSGSALRSASLDKSSKFVSWEICSNDSSEINNIVYHPHWDQIAHCVFAIDTREKEITSSEGHQFAQSSPFHQIRLNYVHENFSKFINAIKDFDFNFVAQFTEQDALNMHAIMQTASKPAIYLNQKTSQLISQLISFRKKTNFQAFWTLDAGPNIHILYHKKDRALLLKFHKLATQTLKQKIMTYE